MKKFTLVLLILFTASALFGQSATGGRTRGAANFDLTVNPSVSGAQILVDGQVISGRTVTVAAGSHTVLVKAAGYYDWQQTVDVQANMTVAANLQPIDYSLQIRANVNGARVFINGSAQGNTPASIRLRPGNYTIRITHPGYQDWQTTVNLQRNETVNATLLPALASVQIQLPAELTNRRVNNPAGQVSVYVNGALQSGNSFQLPPGTHTVELVSGGMAIAQTITVAAGGSYTIVPTFGFTIR